MNLMSVLGIAKKPQASATSLRQALDEIDIPSLEVKLKALEERRRAALLEDDDTLLDEIEAEILAVNRQIEKALAAQKRLQERLRAAEGEEMEEGRRARYQQAQKASAAARKELAKYPALAAQLVEIIETIASAEAEIASANADLPAGVEPLPSAETAARGWPAIPAKETRGRPRQAWFYTDTNWGEVRGDDLRELQTTSPTTGTVTRMMQDRPSKIPVERRTVIDIEVTPGQSAITPTPLASELQLPALHAGLPPIWSPASDPGFFAGGISHFLDDVRRRLVGAREAIAAKPTDPRGMPSKERRVEIVADEQEAA